MPTDGALDAFLKLQRRLPAKLAVQLTRVNAIMQVVFLAVGDISYQIHVLYFSLSEQTVDSIDQHLDDIDILPLIETAYAVCVGNLTLVEYQVDGACMIFNAKPVAYVLSLAIHG